METFSNSVNHAKRLNALAEAHLGNLGNMKNFVEPCAVSVQNLKCIGEASAHSLANSLATLSAMVSTVGKTMQSTPPTRAIPKVDELVDLRARVENFKLV